MKRGATERNLLIAVKLSKGLNFSATFRSEAKEKFKVIFWAFNQRSKATHQEQELRRENRF
jgi:hypothetical protein